MFILHNVGIGPKGNYNTREEILSSSGPLSFDGVYRNVYLNRDILVGRDVTLFVTGGFVGKWNDFDVGLPPEKFCTWDEIMELADAGAKIGWHTRTHRRLVDLSDAELKKELTPPFSMTDVAYPHGLVDDRIAEAAMNAGFIRGWCAGEHGDNSPFKLCRAYL